MKRIECGLNVFSRSFELLRYYPPKPFFALCPPSPHHPPIPIITAGMSEEPEISAEDAELASNLALASEVSTQLEDELVLTSLTGLKTTIEESEGRIKR